MSAGLPSQQLSKKVGSLTTGGLSINSLLVITEDSRIAYPTVVMIGTTRNTPFTSVTTAVSNLLGHCLTSSEKLLVTWAVTQATLELLRAVSTLGLLMVQALITEAMVKVVGLWSAKTDVFFVV
jgi:hypothetical protein